MKEIINWSIFNYNGLQLHMARTETGLCYVGSFLGTYEDLEAWIRKKYPAAYLVENETELLPYKTELQEYFLGTRQAFSHPVDVKGTQFQQAVWKALIQIPYGETFSYSDIAERIQQPKAVRAVGRAIGANPVMITIPCHRVIGKNGAITGYRGGIEMKEYLLQLETKHKA